MKKMIKYLSVIALVVVFATCRFDMDHKPGTRDGVFVPVESIYGIPTGGPPFVVVPLSGTVMPEEATNKKTEWSIKTDGGTKSTLDGIKLTANAEGTVIVTAVIKDGLGEGVDYTEDFTVKISLLDAVAVQQIYGIPETVPIRKPYTLEGRVSPSDALNKAITWSVVDPGTTGATIYGNTLTAPSRGTAVIRATIANGLLKGDYTQDFTIAVYKTVYASGYWSSDPVFAVKACYWVDDQRYDLESPPDLHPANNSYATGIAFAGGKPYIAGYYTTGNDNYLCYWVNGEYKTLPDNRGPAKDDSALYEITRSYGIAAEGTDVYILGKIGGTDSNSLISTYYYWKIDGSNPNAAPVRQQLTTPSGEYVDLFPPAFTGRITLNNGNVYIPFNTTTDSAPDPQHDVGGLTGRAKGYYWDKNGNAIQIGTTGYDYHKTVLSIVAFNGTVYAAGAVGRAYDTDYTGITRLYLPGYWPANNPNNVPTILNSGINTGHVNSIVEQDGQLRFYGNLWGEDGSPFNPTYRWDMNGAGTRLPDTYFKYDTGNIVFSDGDVYMMMSDVYAKNVSGLDAYYPSIGYMALGGPLHRLIEAERGGEVTGIAVP